MCVCACSCVSRAESECDSEFEKESDVTCIASFQVVQRDVIVSNQLLNKLTVGSYRIVKILSLTLSGE